MQKIWFNVYKKYRETPEEHDTAQPLAMPMASKRADTLDRTNNNNNAVLLNYPR